MPSPLCTEDEVLDEAEADGDPKVEAEVELDEGDRKVIVLWTFELVVDTTVIVDC